MAATNFLYDTRDIKFILKEWLDMDALLGCEAYRDYYSKDDLDSFVDVAFKIARDVVAPINEDADHIGVKLVDGQVITPDSFKSAYQTVCEAELASQVADREVEGRLPLCVYAPLIEMMNAASAALPPYWGLTSGAASVIQKFGSEAVKNKFLPKMFSGEWGGTMNLTEAGAGSDVGACATKAFATDTAGLYKVKGTKQFITAGDSDLVSNIVHLVLARIEGARQGTGGLSLFVVPKYWVNDDGSIGAGNDVTTVGIEHKLGLKGSATASLAFGEENNCLGFLLGDPPGEDGKGQGMAQMFNMMNEERLNTGMMALSLAAEAYFNALQYSKERVQGTKLTDPKGPRVRIVEHEDIRRMLLRQKSCTEAIRAMIIKTYFYVDMAHDAESAEDREYYYNMFQVNNPLCKAYASDMAWPLICDAIQTYGGYGFIEEYPVAQLARDCKIYSIWEGTNYIQSLDLVGRKFTMGKGKPFMKWLGEIAAFINTSKEAEGFAAEIQVYEECWQAYQGILGLLQKYLGEGKITLLPLYSTRILHATSMIYCGMLSLDMGMLAARKLKELGDDHFDAAYYKGKVASAKYYVNNEVPNILAIKRMFEIADTSPVDVAEESLG